MGGGGVARCRAGLVAPSRRQKSSADVLSSRMIGAAARALGAPTNGSRVRMASWVDNTAEVLVEVRRCRLTSA